MRRPKRRLKKWVKVVLAVGGMALCTALIIGIMKEDKPPKYTTTYIVQKGDTLWDVADIERGKNEDIRLIVQRIKERNGITDSGNLQVGQKLIIEVPK